MKEGNIRLLSGEGGVPPNAASMLGPKYGLYGGMNAAPCGLGWLYDGE